MKPLQLCIIAIMFFAISACQSLQQSSQNQQRQYSNSVSAQLAKQRIKRISKVSYHAEFDLTQAEHFSARVNIAFSTRDTEQEVSLDFNQAQIQSFTVNGNAIYPNYDGKQLVISAALLKSGINHVSVQYSKAYSNSDEGLIRYIDPLDKQAYIYSHFLPSSAQMMMPLFDQPDLKAVFSLKVLVAEDWQVISAASREVYLLGDETALWEFQATNTISPHSFSLHAGPYRHWQKQTEQLTLNLYAPRSIADKIDQRQWLQQAVNTLNFYQQEFGFTYPFSKYDQLIVPKLPVTAMANTAVSTFEQSLLETESLTRLQRSTLAEQWVSNSVSLDWWDDFWLSQSLARFMAEKAQIGHQEHPIWQQDKHNVYQWDARRNSRPIEAALATSQALEYNLTEEKIIKGVALLTQLNFLLGEKAFNQGLKQYLQLGHANVNNFIASLEQAAKRPLNRWSQTWLYEEGVNTIEAVYLCENNRITHFNLQQTDTLAHPTLREQKVKLGLFTLGKQGIYRYQNLSVIYNGSNTEIEHLRGARCPDLVFPNYQDWGYVKVQLDSKSLQTALMNLSKIEDPQFRIMLWQTLWDSVLSGELSLKRFIGSVMINAPLETDTQVLPYLINKLSQIKALLELMEPVHDNYNQTALKAIEQMSLRLAMTQPQENKTQSLWFDNYIKFATSYQAKRHLAALLAGTEQISGINLNQQRRWAIIMQLNRYDYFDANRLLLAEKQLNDSLEAETFALHAEVSQPYVKQKREWFERIQQHTANADNMNLPKLLQVMPYLYPSEQKALSQATAEQRIEQFAELDKNNSEPFMQTYSKYMLPRSCSYSSLMALTELISDEQRYKPVIEEEIEAAIQAEQQCILIKEKL